LVLAEARIGRNYSRVEVNWLGYKKLVIAIGRKLKIL
jgi:hypothetical protein